MTDLARVYWRVVDREHVVGSRMVVTDAGEPVGEFFDARAALAAVGGHNRDLREGRVVLEAEPDDAA